ncbi:Cysteine--tRNA ligase [Aquicella siphonis]|uniref:Cysteine--tRNA ligase n=1 Tax=Aquicella siphonis TaxID=254247 RepID=A0A5E4PFY0_9COXI|nr:cysteine--tRNA ligase [Aquicella siphonis]VVC75819.1 Cysteine--tRNA ligase [Aquicella siphonis]
MLQIHNTLTRQKQEFIPMVPGKVGMYVCGVTVYDYCHLGHARTYTSVDVIIRYLRWRGYEVNHVRNITDIDDKIIKRASENNEEYRVVTERFTRAMHEDFSALGLTAPEFEPRATDYIPQMIGLIEKIIANQHAYVGANGDVYFDVRSFQSYGCLSHHDIEQLESGARVEISEVKRDPLDFVLWKLAKPGEPSWDSPWGKGRPGWHIECSAMSMDLLGKHFDIHAGGRDLIFPHHENEIAQSEAASKHPFVNLWMHTGFLQMEKEKMSKSLGNFVTIRDVLREHEPEVLRFFLISSHYRSPLIYTTDALYQSRQSLERFYTALRHLSDAPHPENTRFENQFMAAMDDDFNTPVALSALFDLAHEIQRLRNKDMRAAAAHGALLKRLGGVLGILQTAPETFFQTGGETDPAKIEALIAQRQQARREKNWAEADRIRDELASMFVVIEDSPQGTTWKFLK